MMMWVRERERERERERRCKMHPFEANGDLVIIGRRKLKIAQVVKKSSISDKQAL